MLIAQLNPLSVRVLLCWAAALRGRPVFAGGGEGWYSSAGIKYILYNMTSVTWQQLEKQVYAGQQPAGGL